MQRKPGPHERDILVQLRQLETIPRNQVLVEARQEYDQQREAARREQSNLIRRFVHDHVRTLHVLTVRLVGREAAHSVAQEAIVNLTKRMRSRSPPGAIELLRSPQDLLRLAFKLIACHAYLHLRSRQTDPGFEVDRLERAHHELSAIERIVHVLHHYYGFTEEEFAEMFGLSQLDSRLLIHRARRALKHAMGVKQ